jgi:UDP-glucuronate 4-epimerase
MKILVTGAAGFIGYHLVKRLIREGHTIIGLDNINDYYSTNLKYARLRESGISKEKIDNSFDLVKSEVFNNYSFVKLDITDLKNLDTLFTNEKFDQVIHLAAQAGVRHSIENPHSYVQSNLVGFVNILECCRHHKVVHLVYASSSSVYGDSSIVPFSEKQQVDTPVSLYAATKKSNELMAYTYSHLYDLPTTGVRFFTVYGPWGRPDMAPMLFASAIQKGETINVFNNGEMERDFTYIDDIVEGVIKIANKLPDSTPKAEIYNIGNSKPVNLMVFIQGLEKVIGKEATKKFMPMQDGDVRITYADTSKLVAAVDYKPSTELNVGLKKFIDWYKKYNVHNDR